MSPIYYKCDCNGGTPPAAQCLWIYQVSTLTTGDPNWGFYTFVSDITPVSYISPLINPPNGAVQQYTNIVGINGNSTVYGNVGLIATQYFIISYYGTFNQSLNYNFQAIDTNQNPATGSWSQALSCTLKCFEHPFPKPDFNTYSIQMDSAGFINFNFAPSGASPVTLDLVVNATVTDFENQLRSIYGSQVTVTTQVTGSGNIILRINYIYTDQITFTMAGGGVHTMSEVICP
jgi:hypothetical protein